MDSSFAQRFAGRGGLGLDANRLSSKALGSLRTLWVLRGIAALGLGVIILVWPGITLEAVALLSGVFFLLVGLMRIVVGAVDSEFGTGLRVLNVLCGVALAVLGAVAVRYPGFGLWAVAVLVGVAWALEGAVALATIPPKGQAGRGWLIGFGVVSVVAGLMIVLWPVGSLLPLLIAAGAVLVFAGVMDLMIGFSFGRHHGPRSPQAASKDGAGQDGAGQPVSSLV